MLEDRIVNDYKEAMKQKDSVKVSTLNFLRAQLKNQAIEQRKDKLDDQDVIAVIKKQVKQRQDSIEQFRQGGREDLAENEQAELDILKTYLPEELPEEELKKFIDEAIQETGASSMKDMGQVMKAVMPKVAGRADNKQLSALVREKLS